MPDGLQVGLSLEEFSDLISYVEDPDAPPGRRRSGELASGITHIRPQPPATPPDPVSELVDGLDRLQLPFIPEPRPAPAPVPTEQSVTPPPVPDDVKVREIIETRRRAGQREPRKRRAIDVTLPPAPPGFTPPPPPP
jgi:hypothetical protein